jgi:hypothetical protein
MNFLESADPDENLDALMPKSETADSLFAFMPVPWVLCFPSYTAFLVGHWQPVLLLILWRQKFCVL